jgi:tRNA U34 5-methylaminomethyl-2-thiouridine-forming methyltransferase MnmC
LNTKPNNPELETTGYRIVKLANGTHSVHSLAHAETFHPVVGPVTEAQGLYVTQARLAERLQRETTPFVIWDVGLGAGANAITVLRAAHDVDCSLHLLSFDHTLAPLEFALGHPEHLEYLAGHQQLLKTLLDGRHAQVQEGRCSATWDVHLADFPSLICSSTAASLPKPHLVMFDAFSPAKNPAMWTLPVFTNLFRQLDANRPCALPTYSRSTILRVTLLLAGFFVGVGHATGEKEETTFASNSLALVEEPLDQRWLERARRSSSAEPLTTASYRQAALSPESWERLNNHPQFTSSRTVAR